MEWGTRHCRVVSCNSRDEETAATLWGEAVGVGTKRIALGLPVDTTSGRPGAFSDEFLYSPLYDDG